ncbi:hypothetical protein J6590_025990 [Homalodisca vitripennis]|nr:hypothetical protein J6590_025990 [Homalodisca vitripennis]
MRYRTDKTDRNKMFLAPRVIDCSKAQPITKSGYSMKTANECSRSGGALVSGVTGQSVSTRTWTDPPPKIGVDHETSRSDVGRARVAVATWEGHVLVYDTESGCPMSGGALVSGVTGVAAVSQCRLGHGLVKKETAAPKRISCAFLHLGEKYRSMLALKFLLRGSITFSILSYASRPGRIMYEAQLFGGCDGIGQVSRYPVVRYPDPGLTGWYTRTRTPSSATRHAAALAFTSFWHSFTSWRTQTFNSTRNQRSFFEC